MQILTNGFKLPEENDKGSVFFPALEDNIQQLNDHTHNGSNSNKLALTAVVTQSQTITAAGWASVATDKYRQQVSMPLNLSYDEVTVSFRHSVTGELLHLSHSKVSTTSFEVFTYDPTLEIKVVYR